MQETARAKWGYVTRRLSARDQTMLGPRVHGPQLGDFLLATVAEVGEHAFLEDTSGRRVRMYPGDVIVGAYGNRYATDFYEGYLPGTGDPVHLLTSGGLVGTVASSHASRDKPTQLEVIGPLADLQGSPLNSDDFALPPPAAARPAMGTVVVLGSGMNSGKTTTTSAVVRGLSQAGLDVGAGKVTGSGSGKDHWAYLDAGAVAVSDFIDFGMPSTFGYPEQRLIAAMFAIRDQLVAEGAEVVVLEVADGVLQQETYALATRMPDFADRVLLAVGDALGGVAGVATLAELGVPVEAVSGLVTASPLASREAAAATGRLVLAPHELARGAAVDLLAGVPERSHALAEDLADFGGRPR